LLQINTHAGDDKALDALSVCRCDTPVTVCR
jgi:hypothetical protein